MERVIALIQKLQQQLEQKESAEKLLLTVQILYAELLPKQEKAAPAGSDKVAVFMPVNLPVITDINQNIKKIKWAIMQNQGYCLTRLKTCQPLLINHRRLYLHPKR